MTENIEQLIPHYIKIVENNEAMEYYDEIWDFLGELDDEDEKKYGKQITVLHNKFHASVGNK